MVKQEPVRRIPLGIVVGVTALILTAGGSFAWWTWHSQLIEPPEGLPQNNQPHTAQQPQEQTAQIYWLRSTGDRLELTPVPMKTGETEQPEVILGNVFEQLLSGPSNEEAFVNTIPPDTVLRDLTVEADGIHVDLSQEFTAGGGSASMIGRVAQVLYTATCLDADAPVWISVEGEPLEVMAGEGLLISQPMTRQDFNENFTL